MLALTITLNKGYLSTITMGENAPFSGTLEEQCLGRKNYLCLQTEKCNGQF